MAKDLHVLSAMTITSAIAPTTILVSGFFLMSTASGQFQMAPALAPPLPPIVRTQPSAAPAKRASAPASNNGGLTREDLRQFDETMQRLTPKARKQVIKALKQLTPEGRRQVIEGLKRQRTGGGTSSQVTAPHVVKTPPPFPPRLAF